MIKHISDITLKKGGKALVRVDYNVPIVKGKIRDSKRIDASFETIKTLLKKKYQPLLLAHMADTKASLRPVATYLSKHFPVVFITEPLTNTEKIKQLLSEIPHSTVVLFENIRRYEGEEKNDKKFAKLLSSFADVYVNDAFSVSHRAHASIVGVPAFLPSYSGVQLSKEVKYLSSVFTKDTHPFVCVVGGAKFSTKIPLIKRFSSKADSIIIAGAIANSFLKTAGFDVGASVVEDGFEKVIGSLLKSEKVLIPIDALVLRNGKKVVCSIDEIQKEDVVVDIGPQTTSLVALKFVKAKLVVWNGPTGWYEKGFTKATTTLADDLSQIKAKVIIGGGDTGAVVEKKCIGKKNIFVSTGGGATLDFLAKGTLPGVQSLEKSKK